MKLREGNVLHLSVIWFTWEGVICPGESWGIRSLSRGVFVQVGVCVREIPLDRDTPCTVKERAVRIILECIFVIEEVCNLSVS